MARRVTLLDVARHAGVSRATASLVVRDTGNLSERTRDRVRASMRALGYVYHRGAASMRASRSRTVGLVVPNVANAFTAEMAMELETALGEAGVVMLMANSLENPVRQDDLVRSLLELHVDAILVVPANGSKVAFAEWLASLDVVTMIATRELRHSGVAFVGVDNALGGRLAGRHLRDVHGCRSVAYLGGYDLRTRKDRVRGLRRALAGGPAGPVVYASGPPDGAWGLRAVSELLAAGDVPDGIVCHTDAVAFGVYRGLRDHAPDLLDSVRVISYDDVAEAALWEPPLTSIAARGGTVGRQAAETLLHMIAYPDAPPERIRVTPELVVRRSCGCGV